MVAPPPPALPCLSFHSVTCYGGGGGWFFSRPGNKTIKPKTAGGKRGGWGLGGGGGFGLGLGLGLGLTLTLKGIKLKEN